MLSDLVAVLTASPIQASGHHCSKCGPQPEEAFGIYKDRLQSYCRECNKSYQKVWYKKAKASGKR